MILQAKKIILLLFLVIITAAVVCFAALRNEKKNIAAENVVTQESQETQITQGQEMKNDADVSNEKESNLNAEETKTEKKEIGVVPFQVQAPGGRWNEPLFQNGCEEASMIMAARWIQNLDELDAGAMDKEIRRVASKEEKMYGHAVDTSIEDTCETLKQLFGMTSAKVVNLESIGSVIEQLNAGKLIIVNAFGRALGNPNFTSPGPITHMLVIVGYDAQKKQIITNDPGTKNGRGYRYDENVFWKALWNYPTSEEHPEPPKNFGGPVKAIVVGK